MTIRQLFETEMLKRKYINNILNKFNTINIFGFDMVWCSIIGVNVVLLLKYGFPSSNRYPLFAGWQSKSKITIEPEIHWKNKGNKPQLMWSGS